MSLCFDNSLQKFSIGSSSSSLLNRYISYNCDPSESAYEMASNASLPIPLFSREILVKNLFPMRPLLARSVAPVSLNLLLDRPRAVNFILFLIMFATLLEPSGVILFA